MSQEQQTNVNANTPEAEPEFDVLVIGGGAAGIGVAVALKHAGVENYGVIERRTVGASFAAWPGGDTFYHPVLPTKSVGMLDINRLLSVAWAPGLASALSIRPASSTLLT